MKFSLDEAQAQLDELVRRAQDGEDIVPTRHVGNGRASGHSLCALGKGCASRRAEFR